MRNTPLCPRDQSLPRRASPLGYQHVPPPSTLKKASMSASVPTSPAPLKSAVLVQGGLGQLPPRQAKKDSMSASVPTSPSQSKSALPQGGAPVVPMRTKETSWGSGA